MLEFLGLPKELGVRTFDDIRWVCKSPVLQKWYVRSILPRIEASLRPSWVHSYGFERKSSTTFVCSLVRQLLYLSRSWGFPLLISCQDVKTALDSMLHSNIGNALRRRGASDGDCAVLMRELTGLQAVISLAGVGTTPPFPYSRGGKQGGVETPLEWLTMIDELLENLVVAWPFHGIGVKMGGAQDREAVLFHAVWADNIILFASSYDMMQIMVDELTVAIHQYSPCWKKSSLELLAGGTLINEPPKKISAKQDGAELIYTPTQQLLLLGELFDNHGSTETARAHRQGIADAIYYKNAKAYTMHGPILSRGSEWHDSVATSAFFGCQSWHVSAGTLRSVRTWESKRIRRMLRMRWRPCDTRATFNKRTSRQIALWFHHSGKRMAYHRILKQLLQGSMVGELVTMQLR